MTLVACGHVPTHQLEKVVGDPERGVCIRRKILNRTANLHGALTHLPYQRYDYSKVRQEGFELLNAYRILAVKPLGRKRNKWEVFHKSR
jgi:hypothetical protein